MDSGTLIAERYRLDQMIAAGGMGAVWQAYDTRLDREVAVKILHPGLDLSQAPRDRFEREAKTLASLKGPGCVEVYDFGEERDGDRTVLFLVMELVEGVSLAQMLHREDRLDPALTMRIVAEAAEALAAAHRRGIVHRDIKPGNILIDADGRVRVVDFGISLFADRSRLTPSDVVLGTTPYVSPEQLRAKDVTGAADLYSLGAVAYECLTGRPPFDALDPAAVIHDHLNTEPPPLPEEIPVEVAGVVTKSLRKAPEERWESGDLLAAACRAATTGENPVHSGPIPVAAPVTPPSIPKEPAEPPAEGDRRPRRRLLILAIALVAIVAAVGVVAWSPWSGGKDPANAGDGGPGSATTTGAATETPADTASTTAAESQSETATPEETATSAQGETSEGDTEGGGSGGDDNGTEGDGSNDGEQAADGSGEMPPVVGMTTFEARDYLNGKGFTNVTAAVGYYWYTPEPKHCEVMGQTPASGEEVEYDAPITLNYHNRQAEGTSCEW